jgi:hypothetical protein
MNKRELIEKLSALSDNEDIVIALTFPKPEEGYTLGDDASPSSDESETDDSDDDEDGVDNEDGTTTEFYPIDDIDIEEFEEDGVKKQVAFINLELSDEDDEDEDEDSPGTDD